MADSFVQITDLSTVQTLDVPDGARSVLLQAESQAVRYRMDGGSPAADTGMVLGATDPPREFARTRPAKRSPRH